MRAARGLHLGMMLVPHHSFIQWQPPRLGMPVPRWVLQPNLQLSLMGASTLVCTYPCTYPNAGGRCLACVALLS